ncbi:hypothetical protein E1218_23600 [Kribbella turkmenica]|uniref:Uncharacterized protein n=1 Tax=Kribbella turkmenica TaxID=2530375 RepID=A0A4R4WNY1_9ACTN|nr:hypothetical protein [Kribbella turkmenica]TDD19657.1 hypothetical protein E1218_23600 [Kribbella turkmenica]
MASESGEDPGHLSTAQVFSPDVPASARTLLTEHPDALIPASVPHEEVVARRQPAGESVGGLLIFGGIEVGLWFFLRWLLFTIFPDGLAFWLSGGAAVLGVLLFTAGIAALAGESRARGVARKYHGRYLLAGDWDEQGQALMRRAQRAVDRIQDSEVSRRGLLDAAKNDVVLPEQLWDIGRVLQQISVLRARQAHIGEQLRTARLETVLQPQQQALELSVQAMEAKVAKLEQYADQVREADAVLEVETALEGALEDRERYVELLSSTEVAGHGGLIEELSQETADLRETLSRRVAAALESGQALTLPPQDADQGDPELR